MLKEKVNRNRIDLTVEKLPRDSSIRIIKGPSISISIRLKTIRKFIDAEKCHKRIRAVQQTIGQNRETP